MAIGAVVSPQAFAGTLPGFGGRSGGGPAAGAGSRLGGGTALGGGLGGLGRGAGGLGRGAGGLGRGAGGLGRGAGGLGRGAGGQGTGGQDAGGQDAGGQDAGGQQDGSCSDVKLVFARGTGEAQGLGIVGKPLAAALSAALPGRDVTSSAVVYAAAASQASAGPGATDMTQQLTETAQSCPDTKFVIGGYSQGASVTDIAMGIKGAGTSGDAIPADVAPRVAAVVVFGNPLGLRRQTIASSSPEFGPRAKEFCATGDPVCGNGSNFAAHLSYPRDGSVDDAAKFAAGLIDGN